MGYCFSGGLDVSLLCSGVQVYVQVFVLSLRSLNLNKMFASAFELHSLCNCDHNVVIVLVCRLCTVVL